MAKVIDQISFQRGWKFLERACQFCNGLTVALIITTEIEMIKVGLALIKDDIGYFFVVIFTIATIIKRYQ